MPSLFVLKSSSFGRSLAMECKRWQVGRFMAGSHSWHSPLLAPHGSPSLLTPRHPPFLALHGCHSTGKHHHCQPYLHTELYTVLSSASHFRNYMCITLHKCVHNAQCLCASHLVCMCITLSMYVHHT